jgi:hypothetical protein
VIDKLKAYCQKWRGDLVVLTPEAFDKLPMFDWEESRLRGWHEAPGAAGMGIHWPSRRVFVRSTNVNQPVDIIHEMGHVFASKHNPERSDADEQTFLGWEIQVARSIGVTDA